MPEDDEERSRESENGEEQRHIRPGALASIRDTFVVQCDRGRLKKPRIHVHFSYPRTPKQFCTCEGDTDFLFVVVGLCNIFVLQFVVVILLFFVDTEIDIFHLDLDRFEK